MNSNELRKDIKSLLNDICDHIYYKTADKDALFPHLVVEFTRLELDEADMQSMYGTIDVWTKNEAELNDLVDAIVEKIHRNNNPGEVILPTYFLVDVKYLEDEDKAIRRAEVDILAQVFERS